VAWDLYDPVTSPEQPEPRSGEGRREARAAGTDVDVEHGIQRREDRRRAAPRPGPRQRARDIFATLYLICHQIPEPRSGAQPTRARA